jgi:putative tricarboxylic transport membrane protein
MTQHKPSALAQILVGAGVTAVGIGLAAGAISIPSAAGYGGIGPNFLPWLVAGVLALCGVLIIGEARTGGFRKMEAPSGHDRGNWPSFIWVSAGLLMNAALITTIGFILRCTVCYVLAVQGLRRAERQAAANARTFAIDALAGLVISAPVYWTFTHFLAINLPGLTRTGWL